MVRRKLGLVIAALCLIGAVPHFTNAQKKTETKVIVPAWKIQIVDEAGKPVKDAFVYQIWRNYDIEDSSHSEAGRSDEQGYVSFPARRERSVSKLTRDKKRLKHRREVGAHASVGVRAYILAWGEIVGCQRLEGQAIMEKDKPLPTRLQMSITILPGYKCTP